MTDDSYFKKYLTIGRKIGLRRQYLQDLTSFEFFRFLFKLNDTIEIVNPVRLSLPYR